MTIMQLLPSCQDAVKWTDAACALKGKHRLGDKVLLRLIVGSVHVARVLLSETLIYLYLSLNIPWSDTHATHTNLRYLLRLTLPTHTYTTDVYLCVSVQVSQYPGIPIHA